MFTCILCLNFYPPLMFYLYLFKLEPESNNNFSSSDKMRKPYCIDKVSKNYFPIFLHNVSDLTISDSVFSSHYNLALFDATLTSSMMTVECFYQILFPLTSHDLLSLPGENSQYLNRNTQTSKTLPAMPV